MSAFLAFSGWAERFLTSFYDSMILGAYVTRMVQPWTRGDDNTSKGCTLYIQKCNPWPVEQAAVVECKS